MDLDAALNDHSEEIAALYARINFIEKKLASYELFMNSMAHECLLTFDRYTPTDN